MKAKVEKDVDFVTYVVMRPGRRGHFCLNQFARSERLEASQFTAVSALEHATVGKKVDLGWVLADGGPPGGCGKSGLRREREEDTRRSPAVLLSRKGSRSGVPTVSTVHHDALLI
jgi:hypothetical protein